MTHKLRRLITSLCITYLLLLAYGPGLLGQKLKPAEALKFHPQNYANYEPLGDAYRRLGDMELARDAWGKALALSTVAEHSARIQRKLNGTEKP